MKSAAIRSASDVFEMLKDKSSEMDNVRNPFELERKWGEALTLIQRMYNRFENGVSRSKSSDESKAWLEATLQTRDDDPLLRYLIAARHDAEHGLPIGLEVGVQFFVGQTVLQDYALLEEPKPDWMGFMTSHAGTTVMPPAIRLKPVASRRPRGNFKRSNGSSELIYPPLEHLGKPTFSLEPAVLIRIAVSYFFNLINEAKRLPLHKQS